MYDTYQIRLYFKPQPAASSRSPIIYKRSHRPQLWLTLTMFGDAESF